jgi:hypothetical protein
MLKLSTLAAALLFAGISSASGQTSEPLGIPACDAFLTKYDACMARVPAGQSAAFNTSIDQMRTGWKGMAANPQTRASLDGVCKQMQDSMKSALASYGCKW